MTQETLEKWQAALNHWGEWSKNTKNIRNEITAKHGDLANLTRKANLQWPDIKEGNIKSFKDIMPIGNNIKTIY